MSKDYSTNIATVMKALDNYGRTVSLRRLTKAPDPTKPWRDDVSGAAAVPDLVVKALGVGPTKSLSDDFLKDLEDVMIVAGPTDTTGYHELIDGTKVWRILRQAPLKPGDTIILTYLGLTR